VNAEWIGAVIFVITAIFAAGKIISSQRSEIQQLKGDLNGIGRKVRKQHTRDLVLIAMTDNRKERFKLVGILKED
jgi:hypothetical protein